MKKTTVVGFIFLIAQASFALAETTVTVNNDSTTVTTTEPTEVKPQAVEIAATPVIITQDRKTKEFEGEIIRVDYPENLIVVHDAEGRDRKVLVKQGMINNYKVDDYVQVALMEDMKEAKMIHIVRDLPHFEGSVVSIAPSVNQIIIRESSGNTRAVLVAPGTTAYFKAGDHVRIYAIPDQREARFIRVLG